MIRVLTRRFSAAKTVPQVDIGDYLSGKLSTDACRRVAEAFHLFGCLAVKDPRVTFQQNEQYLDLMQRYFAKRGREYYETGKLTDCYPDKGYETGITPEFTERARPHKSLVDSYTKANKPLSPLNPEPDAKWRYMYPYHTKEYLTRKLDPDYAKYAQLDPEHTNPKDFPELGEIMENWGRNLFNCVMTVSEMAALGFDLPKDIFSQKLLTGHNLVAPTGSDLMRHGLGTIFAGFHYDFNFLTIHGKSNFPGLYIWLRTGEKIPVTIPDGYLLLQSGRQFEIVTGGHVIKGMHEVVYDERTDQKVQQLKKHGAKDIWRVSSTMFTHYGSDYILEPLDKFKTPEAVRKYKPISAYDLKEEELKAINLF